MSKVFLVAPVALAASILASCVVTASAQVPGSYRQSCGAVSQDGSMLSAQCRGTDGRNYATTIDVARCGPNGIANIGGRLVCGNVRGSSSPVQRGGYDQDAPRRPPPPRYRYNDDDGAPPPRYAPPPPRGYDDQGDGGGYRPPPQRYAPQGGYQDDN